MGREGGAMERGKRGDKEGRSEGKREQSKEGPRERLHYLL